MATVKDVKRLNAIVDGCSKLSIENQEYILSAIRGMLFTRNLLTKTTKECHPQDPLAEAQERTA